MCHRSEHIFSGIMEGVAYGTEYIFRAFHKACYKVSEIFACGGATRSRLWTQIHYDVSGISIQIPEVLDAPLLGSAILTAVASGLYPTIQDGAQNMVRIQHKILPDRNNSEAYQFFVDRYIETYDKLLQPMHALTAKTMQSG